MARTRARKVMMEDRHKQGLEKAQAQRISAMNVAQTNTSSEIAQCTKPEWKAKVKEKVIRANGPRKRHGDRCIQDPPKAHGEVGGLDIKAEKMAKVENHPEVWRHYPNGTHSNKPMDSTCRW